jgi:hypothetical protein
MMHQEAYCLTDSHSLCLIYSQQTKQAMPWHLSMEKNKRTFSWLQRSAIVISVIALAVIAWQLSLLLIANAPPASATESDQPTVIVLPTETQTLIPPTETLTEIPPPTATPAQLHRLETLITVDDVALLIHLTLEGEIIETLAANYDTTIEVIRSINYNLAPAIWANTPIVIAPGLKEVKPELPTFRAYQVTSDQIDIVDLAALLKVDAELLEKYNNCPQGCILQMNDWIIVPRGQ